MNVRQALFLATIISTPTPARAAQISLEPVADTSILSAYPTYNFGGGHSIVAGGRPLGGTSRALLRFDLTPLPADAIITSASLHLTVIDVPSPSVDSVFALHRLIGAWGEGTGADRGGRPARDNEATWNNPFGTSGMPWTNPGGDFLSRISASGPIIGSSNLTIDSTPNLVADLQDWLNDPTNNFGWLLESESESIPRTIRRFADRTDLSLAPQLTIQFNRAPVAKCKDTTLSAGADCSVTVSPSDVDDGSYDPDAGDTITATVLPATLTGPGMHTVTLTVTDNHGAGSTCTAMVTVQDTTPPSITCPSNVVANATSASGAVVSFSDPAASDNCSVASVSCSPSSGSDFAIGTTTVTCQAVDGSGNASGCTFVVHVKDAMEQINDLIARAQGLGLESGISRSFLAKLKETATALGRGNNQAACGSLRALLNEIDAQKGNKLVDAQADLLMVSATRIRAVLGCEEGGG